MIPTLPPWGANVTIRKFAGLAAGVLRFYIVLVHTLEASKVNYTKYEIRGTGSMVPQQVPVADYSSGNGNYHCVIHVNVIDTRTLGLDLFEFSKPIIMIDQFSSPTRPVSHLRILGHEVLQHKDLYSLPPTHCTQENVVVMMVAPPAGTDLNNVPALEPPPGESSNLADTYSINIYTSVTASLGLGLSVLAIVIRLFVKGYVIRTLQLEEILLPLSQCGFVALVCLIIYSTKFGLGAHQWNVSVANYQKIVKVCIHTVS